jgi:hypothetical protein
VLVDFAETCERTDSSRYASAGIRRGERHNAYNTRLPHETESLGDRQRDR